MKKIFIIMTLIVCNSHLALSQTVFASGKVVNQGSLGVCSSVTLASILEQQGLGEISFIDLAINSSFAKSPLFDLQGGDVFGHLQAAREFGACPRSESYYEKNNNPDDILGKLHEKLLSLLKTAKNFSSDERVLGLSLQVEIENQMKQFNSPDNARALIKSSKFLSFLYQGARTLNGEARKEALDWVDSYADYQFTMAIEERFSVDTVLKDISDNFHSGDAWEMWLKKNVVKSPSVKVMLQSDLTLGSAKILPELIHFSKIINQLGNNIPDTFQGSLRDVNKHLINWVHTATQFSQKYNLSQIQINALNNILAYDENQHATWNDFKISILENLRKFFLVSCDLNSTKRIPVSIGYGENIRMSSALAKLGTWENVLTEMRALLETELQQGRAVAISYDVKNALMNKHLPPLNLSTKPTGYLHASALTGMRKLGDGTIEFQIHNSFGSDCSEYYDPRKCEDGKIWVSEKRLIPFIDSLSMFEPAG